MDSSSLTFALKELKDEIKKLQLYRSYPPAKTRSAEMNELFAALAKAQIEMNIAGTSRINTFYKSNYADFCDVIKASRPALTKNGLSVIQQILQNEDGTDMLHTLLCHSSGQWVETRMRIVPSKPDIQPLYQH